MSTVIDPTNHKTSRQIPIVCPGHTRPLAEVQFCTISPSQNQPEQRTFLISACHDKNPMLRNGITGDWIGTFQGHKGAVWSAKLDPMAYLAATASGDFSVKVWDAITGSCFQTFTQGHVVKTVDWSQNSRYLATGGHEGILRVYDLLNVQQDPVTIRQCTGDEVRSMTYIHGTNQLLFAKTEPFARK
jgi:serine-threonine kinase receptor-associated protein